MIICSVSVKVPNVPIFGIFTEILQFVI